jgi:hypothetical protein
MTTSIKIGNRRLLKLASILDTADAEHRRRGEPTYDQRAFDHQCGTPACAYGHWISQSHVNRRLVLNEREAESEFAISPHEADELFSHRGCNYARTAKQAAKYIRKFVARRSKP